MLDISSMNLICPGGDTRSRSHAGSLSGNIEQDLGGDEPQMYELTIDQIFRWALW